MTDSGAASFVTHCVARARRNTFCSVSFRSQMFDFFGCFLQTSCVCLLKRSSRTGRGAGRRGAIGGWASRAGPVTRLARCTWASPRRRGR